MGQTGFKCSSLLFQSLGSFYFVNYCNKEESDRGGQKMSPVWEDGEERLPKGSNADTESQRISGVDQISTSRGKRV